MVLVLSPVGDHPRSRGVYSLYQAARRGDNGSSPLARGLRRNGNPQVRERRIIPARAGFTGNRRALPRANADHPRSRGVYVLEDSPFSGAQGSSPLARGLRQVSCLLVRWRRIIPARAGFTGMTPYGGRSDRDHPRSRGVYPRAPRDVVRTGGSSPLARGLLSPAGPSGIRRGIIPARAGFTRPRPPGRSWTTDHPRSRGVYKEQS